VIGSRTDDRRHPTWQRCQHPVQAFHVSKRFLHGPVLPPDDVAGAVAVAGQQVAGAAGEEADHDPPQEHKEGPPRHHQVLHRHAFLHQQLLRRPRKVLQAARHAAAHEGQEALHAERRGQHDAPCCGLASTTQSAQELK
jgi:hypothetical protein